jgi:hypothetical protein
MPRDCRHREYVPVARIHIAAGWREKDPNQRYTMQTVVARPNLSDAESRESEELLTEYTDIFAMKSDDCGRTDRIYHRIDTGEARPIRQSPKRLPQAKQADVGEMLENMQRRGVIEE